VSTPVLATKLFPPTRRSELVARPWLADRLDSTLNRGHRLTLVSAPAGFGKTTLLSDWATSRERVGWLSLDEGDNALPRFLAHLWAALSGIGLDMDPATVDALAAAPTSATLTAVVNELVRAGRQRPDSHWLLVLDDYHVIEAPEVHEAMTFLVDHVPDHLHLGAARPARQGSRPRRHPHLGHAHRRRPRPRLPATASVTPWRYVWPNYMRATADRWR
jgi:ATP/maltotriose-dependent transcriptional regulator MalT